MENSLLIALVDSLVSDAIKNLKPLEGIQGVRGLKGRDGNDFRIEDHTEILLKLIKENIPTKIELTEEQRISLKGDMGPRGLSGKDGIGIDGKAGKDFNFEESREEIKLIVNSYIESISESLALKFEDLTEEQQNSLRGPRGQRGKAGRDFDLEESLPSISNELKTILDNLAPELKMKFSELTEEEKDSLKLKFSSLTDDERYSLRGSRGQKGKQGIQGEAGVNGINGKDGKNGLRGIPGLSGRDGTNGLDGRDGVDGEDAPKIVDISVNKKKDSFNLVFEFEDGTEIISENIKIPKSEIIYYPIGGGSEDFHSGYSEILVAKTIYSGKQMINFDMFTMDNYLTLEGDIWLA